MQQLHLRWLPIVLLGLIAGCSSIMNGWLDPSIVGAFDRNRTMEIINTLSIEDMPPGIQGAVEPSQEDLQLVVHDYPISAADQLAIEIYQLRQRFVPYGTQVVVDPQGRINLPVLGWIQIAGLTLPELEAEISRLLQERGILRDPEITINPIFMNNATYSVFGVGVSAANNAPLRAGTFPLGRSDLRLLEAINKVGGLNEFVTEIYIFRYDDQEEQTWPSPPATPLAPAESTLPEAEPGPATEEPFEVEPVETPAEEPPVGEFEAEQPSSPELDAARDELAAVLEPPTDAVEAEPAEVPPELEVDQTQKYIWVNDEFVLNPAYRESPSEAQPASTTFSTPPAIESTPASTWARIAGDTSYRIVRVSADALRSGDPEANIYVRGGDVIRITSGEIGVYYMMGQVMRIGPFAFNTEPITLKSAVAAAGGLTPNAWPDRCTVYRRLGQREQMLQVNLARIFAGKDPDFYVRRGDIINVGTHPFSPFLQRIRAWTLPSPSSTVGYSFVYSRNFADIDSYGGRSNPANQPKQFPNLFP